MMMTDQLLRRVGLNDHLTRYFLPCGWFIDREECVQARARHDDRYEVWVPGTGPRGTAGLLGTAKTLKAALALTEIDR